MFEKWENLLPKFNRILRMKQLKWKICMNKTLLLLIPGVPNSTLELKIQ